MNPLAKRRTKIDPADQRKAQEEVRRQIAIAVSVAERKTQRDVFEALAAIRGE